MDYFCRICGYVYSVSNGDPHGKIPPHTSFTDLPDEWTCPECHAEKDEFSADGSMN